MKRLCASPATTPARDILALAAFLVITSLVSGCKDEVTFSYFSIKVDIDPVTVEDDQLVLVRDCLMEVEGDDRDQESLPCALGFVDYDLGTADFSTNVTEGTLTFKVTLFDLNRRPVAVGSTAPLTIEEGETVSSSILVKILPGLDAGVAPPPSAPDAAGSDI
jgi:hypothetical protein